MNLRVGAALGTDGHVDILAELVEEMEKPFDGKFLEPATHQVGNARPVGVEQSGGLGLAETGLLDQGVNLVRQLNLGKGLVGVWPPEDLEDIHTTDQHARIFSRRIFPMACHLC